MTDGKVNLYRRLQGREVLLPNDLYAALRRQITEEGVEDLYRDICPAVARIFGVPEAAVTMPMKQAAVYIALWGLPRFPGTCSCRCPHGPCQHSWILAAPGGYCVRCGSSWEAHRDQLLEEEQIANIQRYS